jgi:hypothetical protein
MHNPTAFGETINAQKQKIKGNTDGTNNSSITTKVSNNNNIAGKKPESNQNWSINFINLLLDSLFPVYRMTDKI